MMNLVHINKILLSHSRALDMSGRVKKSSEGMLCPCPPDCCPEVEEDESYTWLLIKVHPHLIPLVLQKFLLKVLYGQWIVMGSLVLPIIARQAKASHLEAETPFLVQSLILFEQVDLSGGGPSAGRPDHLPPPAPQRPPCLWQPSAPRTVLQLLRH